MEDDKKDYNDFFKSEDHQGAEVKNEKPSYYYSYGPYKSAEAQERNKELLDAVAREPEYHEVGVSAPPPMRPFGFPQDQREETAAKPVWAVKEPRRRRAGRSFFAGFLAAAVVIASLMFYADKTNMFTGDQVFVGVNSAAAAGNGANVVKAAVTDSSNPNDIVRPNTISQIVKDTSPAVVKIETSVKQQSRSTSDGNSIFNDPLFRQFFGDDTPQATPAPNSNNSNNLVPLGLGSGFIFEKSGYILTNEHVIDGADDIEVTVQGYDTPFKATLLGSSYDLDLAVLKINGTKDFPMLTLGNEQNSNVGDWVVAIGNPYGFDHTVTVGVFSAKDRSIDIPDDQGTREYEHLIQTDASINPGNSGGPLLNLNGEVIGINTAVSTQAQGIGFAIPASTITGVLQDLINNVQIPAPFINATVSNIDPSLVSSLQLPNANGALIVDVPIGGPAFKAGLKANDVVVGVNGNAIKTNQDLINIIQSSKVGDKITLNIVRDGKKQDIVVTVGDKHTDASYQKQLKEQQQQQQQQQQWP